MDMPIRPILSTLRHHKAGAMLIAVQLALTLAVVCNALFVIHGRLDRMSRDTGIAESEIMMVNNRWVGPLSDVPARQTADIATIRALPGVADAFITNTMPLIGNGWQSGIRRTPTGANIAPHGIPIMFVDEHAVPTLGLNLVEGRNFRPEDVTTMADTGSPDAAAIIVTRTLARKAFPEGDALGKQIYIGSIGARPSTIVGIVERLHSPQIYATNDDHWQDVILAPKRMINKGAFLVVRAQPGQLPALMKRIPDALKAVSTQRVIPQPHGVLRFTDLRQLAFRGDRGLAWMLGGISVVLLMVTAAGIVGLTSFWVGQRRRQIGIRRALGARRQDILCYFLTENGLIAMAGIAAGIVLALVLNRWMMSQFEIGRLGATYLAGGILGLLGLGQIAVLAPAIRASHVQPVEATRTV